MKYWKDKKVIVTGGGGFLGSHLCDALRKGECDPFVPRSANYDLRYNEAVSEMFNDFPGKVDHIFNLAANVGGIGYNQAHAYDLYHDNVRICTNLIHQSINRDIDKFIQLGTVCAYPKFCKVPFDERAIWDGYPEETNAPYGLAKKMALVQLQTARSQYGFRGIYLLPTNLYGPRDEFGRDRSHVIPALIRRALEAQTAGDNVINAWGSGVASRDFLHVRDAAKGIMKAAELYDSPMPLNLGSGKEVRISALLYDITRMIGFKGTIHWQTNKPDGQPRRRLNTSHAKHSIGWEAEISLRIGLKETIDWYKKSVGMAEHV